MKKHWKLVVGLLLIACLFVVGCSKQDNHSGTNNSGSNNTGTNNAANNTQNQASSAPIKIEFALWGSGLPTPEDDAIKQVIDEKLGIDLVLNATPQDVFQNQLNARLAAGNHPDLFQVVSPVQLKEYADRGILLDLTPYQDQLGTLIDFQGESYEKGQIEGKQYALIRHADVPFTSLWIRQDWLDHLGLEHPKTLDDLFNVARAFTENDPNQTGHDDTVGITGFEFNTFKPILGAFGVGDPTHLYIKDGQLVTGVIDPDMPKALEYIKSMIDAGIVDREFITNRGGLDIEKAFQGQAGIIFNGWTNVSRTSSYEKYKAINPDAEWVQLDAPQGPGGKYAESYDYAKSPAYFAVSKSLENNPEKLNKIFELYNFLSSEEGLRLVSYGVEGKHHEMDNGNVIVKPLLEEEGTYFWLYQLAGRHEQEYLSTRFHYVADDIDFAINQPRIEALNGYIYDYPQSFNRADVERYIMEELTNFIFDRQPIEQYDSFVETLKNNLNYQDFIDLAEEQLKSKGILN